MVGRGGGGGGREGERKQENGMAVEEISRVAVNLVYFL